MGIQFVYVVHKINADKSKTFEGVFAGMQLAQELVLTNGGAFVDYVSVVPLGRSIHYGGRTSFEITETIVRDR